MAAHDLAMSDQPTTTQPRTWDLFCNDYGPDSRPQQQYRSFHDERAVKFYVDPENANVIPVRLTEDPEGYLLGWQPTGDGRLIMIEHEKIFAISFAYGPKAEVEAGNGQVVRVRVDPR
jgi:hypothetical protein